MTAPCCKAILVPCPQCESPAGKRCVKPSRHGGVIYRKQCHVARSNAFAKVCELLDALGRWQEHGADVPFWIDYGAPNPRTVGECLILAHERRRAFPGLATRVTILDGTVIREWPIDEYDGIF